MTTLANKKLVFVHIAKTAGTSVTQVLRDTIPANRLTIRIHRPLSTLPRDQDTLSFTVIRNPLERLISAFHWLRYPPTTLWNRRHGNHNLVRELGLDRYTQCHDFLDNYGTFYEDQIRPFATNLATCDAQLGDNMTFGHFNLFVPQHLYLTDVHGTIQVDRILRQEHLATDLTTLLRDVAPNASPTQLPHTYQNRRGPARDFVSPRARSVINEIYAADLALPGMIPDKLPPPRQAPVWAASGWSQPTTARVLVGPSGPPPNTIAHLTSTDGHHILTFDPSTKTDRASTSATTIAGVLAALPADWVPDLLLFQQHETTLLPLDLWQAPFPTALLCPTPVGDLSATLRAAWVCDFVVTAPPTENALRGVLCHGLITNGFDSEQRPNIDTIVRHIRQQTAWTEARRERQQTPIAPPSPVSRALSILHTASCLGLPAKEIAVAADELISVLTDCPPVAIDPWQSYTLPPAHRALFQHDAWASADSGENTVGRFLLAYAWEKRAQIQARAHDTAGALNSLGKAVHTHSGGLLARSSRAQILWQKHDLPGAFAALAQPGELTLMPMAQGGLNEPA